MSDGGPPRFYHEADAPAGAAITLGDEETAHAAQSLRLAVGDVVELVDGRGHIARARVTVARRREVSVDVVREQLRLPGGRRIFHPYRTLDRPVVPGSQPSTARASR